MTLRPFALAGPAGLVAAGPAQAATGVTVAPNSLFAGYWNGFIDHWTGVFQQQNGVVMGTLVIGAVCLFIITRGKWKK